MIRLNKIFVNKSSCHYEFDISSDLASFFTGKNFTIEYDEDISLVPKSILAVPFVCNVLPLIWLSGSTLYIEELDKDFFESINEFKKGYIEMFPKASFRGGVIVKNIIKNEISSQNNTAMFFSGGLDSIYSLIRHYKENPRLISIWGSDIFPEESSGWDKLNKQLDSTANEFSLNKSTVKSSFRMFDDELNLSKFFENVLSDNWWHGVQHGIGLIGHSAPLAYLHNIGKVYIASTNCPEDGHVTCASNPSIDNCVKFCGCAVVHDGFDANRQKKSEALVKFCNFNHINLQLHVCYETQDGNNCCKCEKCLRTIMGIIAEKDEPSKYGFANFNKLLRNSKLLMVPILTNDKVGIVSRQWVNIHKRIKENESYLRRDHVWRYIKWISKNDLANPSSIKYSFRENVIKAWNYSKWRLRQILIGMGFKL